MLGFQFCSIASPPVFLSVLFPLISVWSCIPIGLPRPLLHSIPLWETGITFECKHTAPEKKTLTLLVPAPLSCLILVILSELTLALPNICLGQTQHNLFWQEAKGKRIWTVGGNRPYHHWCNFLKEASSAHCTQGMNGNKQRIRS